jgi:hypothetical protein
MIVTGTHPLALTSVAMSQAFFCTAGLTHLLSTGRGLLHAPVETSAKAAIRIFFILQNLNQISIEHIRDKRITACGMIMIAASNTELCPTQLPERKK